MDHNELRASYGKEVPLNSYERVREFHKTFGHPVADSPAVPAPDRLALRLELIREEFAELLDAAGYYNAALAVRLAKLESDGGKPDLVGITDALGDLEYVTNGAALEAGIPLPDVVAEIHRSNMTKLDANGKPIYREDGKILKGEGFEEPRLAEILGL